MRTRTPLEGRKIAWTSCLARNVSAARPFMWLAGFVAGAWVTGFAHPADAALVHVRVPTRCAIELARDGARWRTIVRVTDDRARAVTGARIDLEHRPVAAANESPALFRFDGRTGARGRARFEIGRAPRAFAVVARFAGDASRGACEASRHIDPKKALSNVVLEGPAIVREGSPAASSRFEARVDRGNAPMVARVWRGKGWREIARGKADARGVFAFSILPAFEDGLGPATLRVDRIADAQTNEGSAERFLQLVRPTKVRLRVPAERSEGERVRVRGDARAGAGPLAGGVVSVLRDGVALLTLRTDAAGSFDGELEARALGPGTHTLLAALLPGGAGLEAAVSDPARIVVLPARSLAGRTAWIALAVGLVALGVWWRVRSLTRPARREEKSRVEPPAIVKVAQRLWRRVTASRVVVGRVADGRTLRGVARARVQGGGSEAVCDDDGHFRLGPLEGPRVAIVAAAPGYAEGTLELELPASGAHEVVLFAWRDHILHAFGDAAIRLLPGPPLGERTPADLRRDAERLPADARATFTEVVAIVEDACYSARGANASTFSALSPRLEALRRWALDVPSAFSAAGAPRSPRYAPIGSGDGGERE